MARTIKDTLKAIAPEFASNDDAQLDLYIELADLRVNRNAFGAKADLATALLAAHFLTTQAMQAYSIENGYRFIKAVKLGEVETQYESMGGSEKVEGDEEYTATPYGAQYVQLRRGIFLSPIVG